jgi:hypothetical protein
MEYSNLWNFVQGLTPWAPLAPADVQIALAPFADKLVRVLKFKVRTHRAGWGGEAAETQLIWACAGPFGPLDRRGRSVRCRG